MALSTATISLNVIAAVTKALDMNVSPEARLNLTKALAIAAGVGAGQADRLFIDRRTIAPSGTDDLDLNGVLLDPLGDAFNLARVKGLIVIAESDLASDPINVNDVIVGGAPSNAWVGPFGAAAHTVRLQPGEPLVVFARGATAWPVTAGTADLLRIANSAGGSSVIYQIAIIGASA
jgi:hypothetical protein